MGKKGEPPPVENPKTRFLLGTFSAPPSLAINEPWSDRRMLDSRHKGKNMGAGKWRGADKRTEQCAPGTFKIAPFLFANFDSKKNQYMESIKYRERFQGADKRPKGAPQLGFFSTDFPKRDEFTNTIRTEQLREGMKRERITALTNRAAEDERMANAGVRRPQTANPYGIKKVELYDLVFRIPPTDLHMKRDDRQGKPFFMALRQKEKLIEEGKYQEVKPNVVEGHAWISVTLPDGQYRYST